MKMWAKTRKPMIISVGPSCEFTAPFAVACIPGESHYCAECGLHRFAAIHRPTKVEVDPRAEIVELDSLGWRDAEDVERFEWRTVGAIRGFSDFCSSWEYDDVLKRANMRALWEIFDECEFVQAGDGSLLYDAEGDTVGLLIDTFDALHDYPVVSDEVLSRVEDEEFWETLTNCYTVPMDVDPSNIAQYLQEYTSCYRAEDLSQQRVNDAVTELPHVWRNHYGESAEESDCEDLADACMYCDKSLSGHDWESAARAAEAAGQLPVCSELALSC